MERKELTNEEINQRERNEWRKERNRKNFEELMKWEAKQRELMKQKKGGKVSHMSHNHKECHHGKYGKFDYHMGNPFELKGNTFSRYR